MSKCNQEGISRELNYFGLSISSKTKVLIVGGGRAAYIKAKGLIRKSADVTIISESFSGELLKLKELKLINKSYYKEIIINYHIVIIAIDNIAIKEQIKNHCDELFKLYIDCSDFKSGLAIMQSEGNLKNISYSVSTKVGTPKLSKLLLGKIEGLLKEYDDFALDISRIRTLAKKLDDEKKKAVINFICTEDFKFFFEKGKSDLVIKIFFEGFDN